MDSPLPVDKAPPAGTGTRPRRGLFTPAALVAAGVLALAAASIVEERWLGNEPWHAGMVILDDGASPPPPDALAVRARLVTRDAPAPGDALLKAAQKAAGNQFGPHFRLDTPEVAIAVAMPPGDAAPLLASGRLPKPGAREALAGDLARDEPFTLGGEPFEVVGRLRTNVGGFVFSYLLVDHPGLDTAFPDDGRTVTGWAHPQGAARLGEMEWGDNGEEEWAEGWETAADMEGENGETLEEEEPLSIPEWQGGQTRTLPLVLWTALLGVILTAAGGAMLHTRLCLRWAEDLAPDNFFAPLFREVALRPRLWRGMHLALYGVMFYAMMAAISQPLFNHRMLAFVSAMFTEGGLDHVGEAYASGSILQAAWATWKNNYLTQTVLWTFLLSVFPVALGVLKTAASFLLAGVAMAPLWTGTASMYVFHVITMVLEFEAYIMASFVVVAWAIRIFQAGRKPGPVGKMEFHWAVRIFGGAILATGILLAVAAFYEAATLVTLTAALQ
ncbi:MAG: hypothetical protein GX580_12780 [Candidatus Hydrogenedens sp.]|nr:hypothetical protein [Candidatus Hydrogenedentota bacterium]NLF58500.1 hypothetical protein [Candidatus Hydrogenedens sp.]